MPLTFSVDSVRVRDTNQALLHSDGLMMMTATTTSRPSSFPSSQMVVTVSSLVPLSLPMPSSPAHSLPSPSPVPHSPGLTSLSSQKTTPLMPMTSMSSMVPRSLLPLPLSWLPPLLPSTDEISFPKLNFNLNKLIS